MATRTKKIDGKVYRLYKVYSSGHDARAKKAKLRKQGKSVRIIEGHGVQSPYALYVHEGTKAHIIRPRIKQALYWKGALHPVKIVQHPGTKKNPFVERTVREVQNPVQRIFLNTVEEIIKKLA